jgi:hypothetical protein
MELKSVFLGCRICKSSLLKIIAGLDKKFSEIWFFCRLYGRIRDKNRLDDTKTVIEIVRRAPKQCGLDEFNTINDQFGYQKFMRCR